MLRLIKRTIKRMARRVGVHVARGEAHAEWSLVGIRHRDIRTVIDIGANEGQFLIKAMDLFPDATFICFEPLPVAFQRLEARASSQRRVTAINVALGERNGRATIHLHSEHSPSSSLLPSTALTKALFPFTEKQRDLDVPMMTLDAAMDALEWPLNDEIFIKMDVQGYEHRVIKGGPRSLRRCCACMLEVSLDQLYVGQPSFEELICQMKDLGFRYYGTVNQRAAADGHVVYADVMFLNQERDAAKAKTKHVGL